MNKQIPRGQLEYNICGFHQLIEIADQKLLCAFHQPLNRHSVSIWIPIVNLLTSFKLPWTFLYFQELYLIIMDLKLYFPQDKYFKAPKIPTKIWGKPFSSPIVSMPKIWYRPIRLYYVFTWSSNFKFSVDAKT